MHLTTDRLELSPPTDDDLDALHRISSDPRLWTHYPSLCHTELATTRSVLTGWQQAWERDGLATWVVRRRDDPTVIGYGGCGLRHDTFWNLGYRLAPEVQGRGLASELARAAVAQARRHRPEVPVVAYLLEHNTASARVAEKVGLELVHRGPDAGNPDPGVLRLVYSDRPLSTAELSAALR